MIAFTAWIASGSPSSSRRRAAQAAAYSPSRMKWPLPMKPADVPRAHHRLAEPAGQLFGKADEPGTGALARDQLEELLDRRRVVEVKADDAAVEPGGRVEPVDRNGGGVGQEQRFRRTGLPQTPQQACLEVFRLGHRFEQQGAVPRRLEPGSGRHQGHGPVAETPRFPFVPEAAPGTPQEVFLQIGSQGFDRLRAAVDKDQLASPVSGDLQPGHQLRGEQGDAAAHLAAGADHRGAAQYAFDLHG